MTIPASYLSRQAYRRAFLDTETRRPIRSGTLAGIRRRVIAMIMPAPRAYRRAPAE